MSVAPPTSFRDPFAPASKPLPPPAPKPVARRPLFWAGAALAAVVVVGASAGATIALYPRKTPALPYDAARFPPTFGSMRRWTPDPDMPPEREASRLARSCGGADVIGLALAIDMPFAKEILADAIASREETTKALKCGAAVAKDIGRGPSYTVTFRDDKTIRAVFVYPTKLATWPDASKRLFFSEGPKSLASLACFREAGEGACPEGSQAVAKIPGTTLWLTGRLDALDTVASAYEDKKASDRSKAINALAPEFEGFDFVELGTSDADFFFRADETLDDFHEEVRKAQDAFKKSLERSDGVYGFGEARRGYEPSDDVFEVVTQREEDAKDVETALKDLRLALKHAKPRDIPDELSRVQRKAYEAYGDVYRRAIDESEVDRQGSKVRLVVSLKPEKAEKDAFIERDKDQLDRAKHGVALYRALLEGKEPSEDVLQAVGGADLVRATRERKDGPPSFDESGPFVDVSSVPGLSLPAGSKSSSSGNFFTYENPKDDLVDRLAAHLRKTGWSLYVWPSSGGPSFECTRDGQSVTILVFARKHSVDIDVIAK